MNFSLKKLVKKMTNKRASRGYNNEFHKKKDIYNTRTANFEKTEESEIYTRALGSKDAFTQYCSLWREYPDLFIDMITPPDSKFRLFFYQRVFLRVGMRYRYVYATFTRAFSKSFLSIMTLYLKCIFYPGIKLFVASGTKEQAANIAKEKIEELWEIFPLLERELKHYQFGKDYVKLTFQNGSKLDIVGVQNSTRGGRRHGGLAISPICQQWYIANPVNLYIQGVRDRLVSC